MEETPVCAIPNLVDHVGLKINVKRPRNVFSGRGLGEERAEATIIWGAFDKATIGLDESDQRDATKERGYEITLRPCSTV